MPVDKLESFFNELPRLNKKKQGNIFYRGQSNIDEYKLTPSVFREGKETSEHKIYNEIMTECAHEFDDCQLHNEILSKMQHYGVPTRLLDVTTNALVALYFACASNPDVNGAVYVIQSEEINIKRFDSDTISILSSLPRFKYDEKITIRELAEKSTISEFNEELIIKRLLHEIKKEKPAFENIIDPADLLKNYVFIPRKVNARIIRQSGAFIIFGLGQKEIAKSDVQEIVIDKNSKNIIIDQLSCFGISKASLHPELYKVAEYISEKYKLI